MTIAEMERELLDLQNACAKLARTLELMRNDRDTAAHRLAQAKLRTATADNLSIRVYCCTHRSNETPAGMAQRCDCVCHR